MNSTALDQPGDIVSYSVNGVRIQLQVTIDGGYTRTVMTGPTVVSELSAGYTDAHTARTQARQLAQALKAGASVWQLAAEYVTRQTQVLASADDILDGALQTACAAPVTDAADTEITHLRRFKPVDTTDLADRINADLDAQQAHRQAEVDQLNADVADIMAGSRGFRGDRKSLAETVPAPMETRQVRATLAGAHLADISAPQQRAIDHHRNGRVHVGQGVTRPMLTALARKGFGTLNHAPGMGRRQVIDSLTLNQRGLNAARIGSAA